ncbi:DUF58 domain-containing protein [Micromonospora sp. WMMD882]|uniref:DUF58 domain-containing protein n=1 Tax=Micromonospora sp. WMMD882 TaxID=3015151 RepID=UPI00248AC9D3|nr:DUF58 domain-containing protein [Micromonospora sp. WMMD882]WBB82002.1 DUF58 domain-containing protein [Micromonospora sp. WMMD882]
MSGRRPAGTVRRPPADPAAAPGLADLAPERKLRRLELTVTRRLDGLLHGQHRGLLPGSGSEIAGSREYRPGEDEVRRMDWAVTARTAVAHVREVDADRELTTWLLVDASPSMEFGTGDLDKRELAVAAVAAVGFLTAGTGNRLGAQVLTATGLWRFPARSGRRHLLNLLRTLLAAPRAADPTRPAPPRAGPPAGDGPGPPPGGGSVPPPGPGRVPPAGVAEPVDLAGALAALRRLTARRGVVVVVSDFLDALPDNPRAEPPWARELRRLAVRHQVLAVEVTDPREWELPDVGLVTLVDPETGRRREVWTGDPALREAYARAAADQRDQVRRLLRRCGVAHLALRTDRDWTADIVRHVHAQRRSALAPSRGAPGGLAPSVGAPGDGRGGGA